MALKMIAEDLRHEIFLVLGFRAEKDIFAILNQAIGRLCANGGTGLPSLVSSWGDDLGKTDRESLLLMLRALLLYAKGFEDEGARYETLAIQRLDYLGTATQTPTRYPAEERITSEPNPTPVSVRSDPAIEFKKDKSMVSSREKRKKKKTAKVDWIGSLLGLYAIYNFIKGQEIIGLLIIGLMLLHSISGQLDSKDKDEEK